MPMPQAGPSSAGAVEGFVLAGGASSRFGADKSLARLAGVPLVAHALRLLSQAGVSARVAGARTELLADFAAIVPDASPGAGPLAGVLAGLRAARAEWSIFLPVDMPLIPVELLRALIARAALTHAPVTCLRLLGHLEPFPALLHRSMLPSVSAALASHASCARLWRSCPGLDSPAVESLTQAAQLPCGTLPAALWWRSANTAEELACLESFFALGRKSRNLDS